MKSCRIKSYAKINLYLEVLKKRKDNYHQLITLFEKISLADDIVLTHRPDKKIRVTCNHPKLPASAGNLAYRAAMLLRKDFGLDKGVDIRITKRIPLSAGLGGGSSNAASVLLGLNRLWALNLDKKKVISYGKILGADVPFFLSAASFAVGTGRGDEIKPLAAIKKRFWHVLAVPRIKVSTKRVYAGADKIFCRQVAGLTKSPVGVKILTYALKEGRLPLARKFLFNRLETVTFGLYPKVRHWHNLLTGACSGTILMSGSGPAMFGIFSSRKEAGALCKRLAKFKKCDKFVVRTR